MKKLFDRNPLLFITGDKYKVKEFFRKEFGDEKAEKFLIPTLYAGDDPVKIPFDQFPEEYIIKGCHLSGNNLMITKDVKITKAQILHHCRFLLKKDISNPSHAWFYSKIPKRIIIEPLLRDKIGKIPQDYKFFCFNGRVRMFQVDFDRFGWMRRSLFDQKGKFIEGDIKYPYGNKYHGIKNLRRIIEFVESLCFNLDFVRVDIYIVDNRPIFGELTHYPGAGHSKISPFELDLKLGNYWQLGNYFNGRNF
ncbi:MAG: ATP-grasp fold amidoligase family protein [Anditalea sp.]